ALAYPLAKGKLSSTEWQQLVGPEVDWNKSMVTTVGDVATSFQNLYQDVISGAFNIVEDEKDRIKIMLRQKYLPLVLTLSFQRDYRFAMGYYMRFLHLLTNRDLTSLDVYHRLQDNWRAVCLSSQYNFPFFSAMSIPALNRNYFQIAAIDNFRRVALMAGEVEQYRRKHGGLPESLSFLPPALQDSPHYLPVIYEHGEIEVNGPETRSHGWNSDRWDSDTKGVIRYGFRLYLLEQDGRDPGGLKAENAFTVLLSRPGKTKNQ
ncbi:MAG: hypothetical protein PHQ27_07215, partial [Victivallales bacterium]|nr:hypothetical protein [Victivallales bacterium]